MDRNAQSQHQQHRTKVQRRAGSTRAVEFFNVLSSPAILQVTESLLPEHRERLYPPTVSLSMFMRQTLEADGSCQKAVNGWAAQRVADGLRPMSVRTGGYCRARQRLPVQMVSALTRETGRQLCARSCACWRWRGRTVKLVDGTGMTLPDTEANQARYPQPSSQAPGVGLPQARLVAVICLASGAVLDRAMGSFSGKGQSELALLRQLGAAFQPDDVMLADALYCNYFTIGAFVAAGVDVLFEQHGSRITDFRRGRSLGVRDHLVSWTKPARPEWMTREVYAGFADTLTMREAKLSDRVLVTTMIDHRALSKQDLSALYARRWHIELDLRNIKTTMGMEALSCHTPQMNEKQVWVHLLAYNIVRLLMAQAACNAGVDPRGLSFKHTLQLWTEWVCRGLTVTADSGCLFQLIVQTKVGHRPGRIEPRMRKQRPKSFPWLKEPRDTARARVRRHGHVR